MPLRVTAFAKTITIPEHPAEDGPSLTATTLDAAPDYYRENGYVVLRGLVPENLCDAVRAGLGAEQSAEQSAEEAQLLEALSRRAGPEKWAAVVDRCLEAEIQLDRYIQVGLVLEGLLDALSQSLDG